MSTRVATFDADVRNLFGRIVRKHIGIFFPAIDARDALKRPNRETIAAHQESAAPLRAAFHYTRHRSLARKKRELGFTSAKRAKASRLRFNKFADLFGREFVDEGIEGHCLRICERLKIGLEAYSRKERLIGSEFAVPIRD